MALSPGTHLGPYQIVARLGAGGMGEVYRARDTQLGRDVALKVLPETFASDPERMGRFEREAKVLASLNHPNIAAIYGFEVSSGAGAAARAPFPLRALVMELVEGPALAERVAHGAIPLEEALPIARQIAEGLEYAHDRGIVHRDLKPANIKITPEGVVKLLDFGLAKALEGETISSDISSSPTISRLATQAGIILGTAAYMSPEQAKGKPADRRADVWSFGCVLYEMLAAKKPFNGETITDILAAVVKEDPDWAALPSATPRRIRELLRRCLVKDPRQRLQSIGEARIAIDRAISGAAEPESSEPSSARPRSRREIVAWSLVVLLAIAVAAVASSLLLLAPRSASAPPALAYIPPPPGVSFRSYGFDSGPVVVSPDGQELAFSAVDEKGVTKIWLRPLAGGNASPLSGTEDGALPFWSPDSRSIGFFADGRLKTISVENGSVQTLSDSTCPGFSGAWSSQGVILFVAHCGGSMDEVPAGGGTPRPVPSLSGAPGRIDSPAFLPGGDKFLYSVGYSVGQIGQHPTIRIASLGAGSSQLVLSDAHWPHFASGHLLFLRGGRLFAQPFDPEKGSLSGQPQALQQVVAGYSVSANGVLAFQGGNTDARLQWFDRNGNPQNSIGATQLCCAPKISPDGKHVLVVSRSAEGAMSDLWSYPAAGGVGQRLTFGPGNKLFSVWSPDGKFIAYACTSGDAVAICRKPSDGSGAGSVLLKFDSTVSHVNVVDWSPDGRYLSFDANSASWVFPLDGSRKPFQFARVDANQYDGNFSRDGHWLAYFSYETGRPEVFVVPFPPTGAKFQISQTGGWLVRWAAGDKLFFLTMGNRLMEADLAASGKSVEVKAITPLFQLSLPMASAPLYDVTPDATRFIVATSADPAASTSITLVLNWPALLQPQH